MLKEMNMFVVIFGRPGCPFCVRAKDLAEDLKTNRDDFNYRYVDIHAEGISKADLEKTVGKPVETVPQIFVDQAHVGGFTEFEAYAKENLGLFQD
jgi:Glutaredoxin, GrxA family